MSTTIKAATNHETLWIKGAHWISILESATYVDDDAYTSVAVRDLEHKVAHLEASVKELESRFVS
jgi:hypothetical protein